MTLNEWAAKTKTRLFEDLSGGQPPSIGSFDQDLLREAKSKGRPQIGATEFAPDEARFEFVYSDSGGTMVFSVRVVPPQRIVFLPVPQWVVESVWEGHVTGSFHFEDDARRQVEEFAGLLGPEPNRSLFGEPRPIGRH